MSYVWGIAGDAQADLWQLDPAIQERVLDEVERASERPEELRVDSDGCAIRDFDHELPGGRHVVFISLHRDDKRRLLTLLGVADHVAPP